jgi:hypothetical protein
MQNEYSQALGSSCNRPAAKTPNDLASNPQ